MITEEAKSKAVKQFKLQLSGALEPFGMYGLREFFPQAIEEITEMSLLLHKRLNGQDIPVTHEHAKIKLKTRYKKGGE